MSENENLKTAILQWLKTFDFVPKSLLFSELADGQILNSVLTDIDPQWFKPPPVVSSQDAANWVLVQTRLKKIHKQISQYYEAVLGQDISGFELDLYAMAKDQDVRAIVGFCKVVLALAVQSTGRLGYIERIQGLGEVEQHSLMVVIEEVISIANAGHVMSDAPATQPAKQPATDLTQRITSLETQLKTAQEATNTLQTKNTTLQSEKQALEAKLRESEEKTRKLEKGGQMDVVMKAEIDGLRLKLDKSEVARLESDGLCEKQNKQLQEQAVKLEELGRKAEESAHLKDQLDEFQHVSDKLMKAEALLDKYRKSGDSRKQIKDLEVQNEQLLKQNTDLEVEYRKLSALNVELESFKSQFSTVDAEKKALAVENVDLKQASLMLEKKCASLELENQNLREQMHELELRFQNDGGLEMEKADNLGVLSEQVGSLELSDWRSKVDKLERVNHQLLQEVSEKQKSIDSLATLEKQLQEALMARRTLEKQLLAIGEGPKPNAEAEDQVKELQKSLKKAKEYILSQDQKLKDLKAAGTTGTQNNFQEALTSLQSSINMKDEEIGRLTAEIQSLQVTYKTEQRVILSSWLELAMLAQKRTQNAPTKSSWLAQQRKNILDSPIKRKI